MIAPRRACAFLSSLLVALPGAASAAPDIALEPASDTAREAEVAALFERLAEDPARLRIALQAMPKGGDLHNHLSGTPYPEDYLAWAGEDGLCVDETALALVEPPCASQPAAAGLARRDPALYDAMVDSLSTRAWQEGVRRDVVTGHEQFFATFAKFGPAALAAPGRSIAAARRYGSGDRVLYLELIHNPEAVLGAAVAAAEPVRSRADFATALSRLEPLMPAILAEASAEMDEAELIAGRELGCAGDRQAPGCEVVVRYNAFVLRGLPPGEAFRMMALGFALAHSDPRFVGITIVAPEDGPVALADYRLHMAMFAFLAERFPDVRLSPHAGELALGQVPPTDMKDHVAQAIATAGARRIGHGTAIAYEADARETLGLMARERIAVEINLSSNDIILGVTGAEHPLRLYLAQGVPVVLSTDDEGVLRIDLTHEYRRAMLEHGLGYGELKQVSRASLEHAFIEGESLWADGRVGQPEGPCARSLADMAASQEACARLLEASPKAALQWRLERELAAYEREILDWNW